MKFPPATRADHQAFCEIEGWERVRDARGGTGTHHVTYRFALPDGRVLRTRVSHPADRSTCGPAVWAHILRDQLQVSAAEFWACVKDKALPDRGGVKEAGVGLPAALVFQLLNNGVPESDIAQLTKEAALQLLSEIWSMPKPRSGP